MHYISVLGGVALLSLVSAAPVENQKRTVAYGDRSGYLSDYYNNGQYGQPTGVGYPAPSGAPNSHPPYPSPSGQPGNPGPSGGLYPTQGGPPPPTGSGSAGAVTFPLANGFPNIQNPSDALTQINKAAQGTLPNGPPPAKLSPDTLTSLQLIAFNEIFEVFYFQELLNNVTNNVPGYQFQDPNLRSQVIAELTAVVAQEELHALNANGALKKFGKDPIQPCKYNSPVSDFKSAIALASTFTDVVLGTLQDVIVLAANAGDGGLGRGVASVIGQEGEQNGFYRSLLGKLPSALPFLTASARPFAFSALNQNFVQQGTCPNANTINLPVFGALSLVTQNVQAQDQTLEFSFTPTSTSTAQGLSIVYINQQNVPVVLPIQASSSKPGGAVSVKAFFPYNANLMNGLTIAALVQGAGPFASVDDVAAATKFGPALIEIN